MPYRLICLCAVLLLAACTKTYTPAEIPLAPGAVAPFEAGGPITINNTQSSSDSVVVYTDTGTKWTSDLRTITEAMVQQASEEVRKGAHPSGRSTAKAIDVKVERLSSEYNLFHWNSELEFSATLGTGETIAFSVRHNSGIINQDLNGCIAEAVRTLLNDQRVRVYLAS